MSMGVDSDGGGSDGRGGGDGGGDGDGSARGTDQDARGGGAAATHAAKLPPTSPLVAASPAAGLVTSRRGPAATAAAAGACHDTPLLSMDALARRACGAAASQPPRPRIVGLSDACGAEVTVHLADGSQVRVALPLAPVGCLPAAAWRVLCAALPPS
eukprot:144375-Chlamydomonas_euryale.AAC.1